MRATDVGTSGRRWLLLLGISCCILILALIMEPPASILFVAAVTALLFTYRSVQAFRYRSWNLPLAMAVFISWLFFYSASIGPAVAFEAWLGNWTAPGLDAVELLYFPLLWLSESFVFEQPLDSYVDLWEDYASGRTSLLTSSTWSFLSIALVPLSAIVTAVAFWKDMVEPVEKITLREQFRFRLKTLLLVVGGLAVLLGCASAIVRWHVAQGREHIGRLALGNFGGTFSMQSAVNLRETGSPPSWFSTTFFNFVAEVDLSVDAWPATEARASGKTLPRVTDDDLQLLTNFIHLRSLDLHGQAVTDEGMKYVKRLRHLRKLNIADTQVSDTAVKELQSALPGCHIQR